MMKFLAVLFVTAAGFAVLASPADARGGCGIGRHPGPLGVCHDNEGVPPGKVCPIGWHLGPEGHCRRN